MLRICLKQAGGTAHGKDCPALWFGRGSCYDQNMAFWVNCSQSYTGTIAGYGILSNSFHSNGTDDDLHRLLTILVKPVRVVQYSACSGLRGSKLKSWAMAGICRYSQAVAVDCSEIINVP